MTFEFSSLIPLSPFIIGGIGYAIHNERRVTRGEATEKSIKEKVDSIETKVNKIYELALENSMHKNREEGTGS